MGHGHCGTIIPHSGLGKNRRLVEVRVLVPVLLEIQL